MKLATAAFLLFLPAPLAAPPAVAAQSTALHAQLPDTAGRVLSAIESGEPQPWADALLILSNSSNVSGETVARIAQLLRDSSSRARARAAMALAALGRQALPALPDLLRAARDPDSIARAEIVFALGATGARTDAVLRGIFDASTADASPLVGRAALLALSHLGRRPLIPVAADFASELRGALRSPTASARSLALRILMRSEVPWAGAEFIRLLRDHEPSIRLDAAFALAGTDHPQRTAILQTLAQDSVEWIRNAVPGLLRRTQSSAESDLTSCRHRAQPGSERVALALHVDPLSRSLRDDGRGPYSSGVGGVRLAEGTSLNFFLPNAPLDPGVALLPTRAQPNTATRTVLLELSDTAFALRDPPPQIIRDPAARIHAFFLLDARRTIWNVRDIPVGATVTSSRTQINFFRRGRYHILQFGPWALGDCGEEYSPQTKLNGRGTSAVKIQRLGPSDYRLWAEPGTLARLWDVSDKTRATDLGLYRFAFDVRITRQP